MEEVYEAPPSSPSPPRVSSHRYNPFPHHWGASVACGAVAGVLGGYIAASQALPLLKRSWDLIYIGRCSLALCVRGGNWTPGTLAKQVSTACLASYRKGLKTHKHFVSGRGLSMHWENVLYCRPLLGVYEDRRMTSIEKEAANLRIMTTRIAHINDPKTFPVLVVGPGPTVTIETLTDMLRDL